MSLEDLFLEYACMKNTMTSSKLNFLIFNFDNVFSIVVLTTAMPSDQQHILVYGQFCGHISFDDKNSKKSLNISTLKVLIYYHLQRR